MGLKENNCSTVRVTILDQNDSPPSFRDMPRRYTVSEDHQAGRRVATITASDSDILGTLSYSLVSGDDGKFSLDETTGHLSLRETLDRETKDLYELVVRASDAVQHTDTTVYIQVTDTNDNPPQFYEHAYSFDVPENAKGSQVR
ncbi:hypothetical protein HAZT_HAZT002488 [Hyalella azteca]|uniref:Cadherin domain-containing protein n=1 Tax=Hyalella azteca TaxID=294128 RepID=A0A6A0GTC4_HYAAZ|nr:hypothetical protein HAZT_HAZT002488 [Hyalella azteca]